MRLQHWSLVIECGYAHTQNLLQCGVVWHCHIKYDPLNTQMPLRSDAARFWVLMFELHQHVQYQDFLRRYAKVGKYALQHRLFYTLAKWA